MELRPNYIAKQIADQKEKIMKEKEKFIIARPLYVIITRRLDSTPKHIQGGVESIWARKQLAVHRFEELKKTKVAKYFDIAMETHLCLGTYDITEEKRLAKNNMKEDVNILSIDGDSND